MVEPVGRIDDAAPDRSLSRWVQAPHHPFADQAGRVPAEVFDIPPELLGVVRSTPIKAPGGDAAPPRPEVAPAPAFDAAHSGQLDLVL